MTREESRLYARVLEHMIDLLGSDERLTEAQISKDSELAFTTERDHYLGSLQTRPDFGCVLHEPQK